MLAILFQPANPSLDTSLGGAPYVATDEDSKHQGYYPGPPTAPVYPHDKYDVIFCSGYLSDYHNIDDRATYILPLDMSARGKRITACVDGADDIEQWDPPKSRLWRVKKRKRPGSPHQWSDETSFWPMRKIKIFDQVLQPVEYEPDNKPSTY